MLGVNFERLGKIEFWKRKVFFCRIDPYCYRYITIQGLFSKNDRHPSAANPSNRPHTILPYHTDRLMKIPSSSLHTSPLVSHEPVGNRLDISTSSADGIVEIVLVHGPGVVAAERLVVVVVPGVELLEAVPGRGTLGAVADHLEDAAFRIARVEGDAGVGLHDARVADAVVGGADADVAAGFLHDDAEDDAGVDAGLGGDFGNRFLDEADFAGAVVEGHQGGVLGPEGLVAGPGAWAWEVGSGAAVLDIATTDAGTGRAWVVGWAVGWGAPSAGEFDDLTNMERTRAYSRVGGLDGRDRGTVALSDGPEGVA